MQVRRISDPLLPFESPSAGGWEPVRLDVERAITRLRGRRFDYPPVDLLFVGEPRPDLCVGLVPILADFLEDLGGDAPPGATVRVVFSGASGELIVTISLVLKSPGDARGLPPIVARVLARLLRSTLPSSVNYRCYKNRMIRLGGEMHRESPGSPVQLRVPSSQPWTARRSSSGN